MFGVGLRSESWAPGFVAASITQGAFVRLMEWAFILD
jgi:hypothetical protein